MKRIAELRKENHMTQIALALKLNVTQNMISFYETGKYQPSIEILSELSKIFNTSIDYITGNSDIRHKADYFVKEQYTPTEAEMICLFKTLNNIEQQRAIGIIQAVKSLNWHK